MEAPQAIVDSISADSATVRVARQACPRCAAGNGCGAGIFAGRGGDVSITVRLERGVTVRVGDAVSLSLASGSLLRATFLAYGLPLIGLLLASGIALASGRSDGESVVWGLAGMLTGFMLARRRLRRNGCHSALQPRLGAGRSAGAPQ